MTVKVLEGLGVSAGIEVAKAFLLEREDFIVPKRTLSDQEIERDIERLRKAIEETIEELSLLERQLDRELGDAYANIFHAHIMLLKDETFFRETVRRVREQRVNIEYALTEEMNKVETVFTEIRDTYLRERGGDVRDVGKRLLRKLLGKEREELRHLTEPAIVVAHDLSPSETASMSKNMVVGLATDVGGPTSHTAILARALEIPAVVGLRNVTRFVAGGDTVVVDGNRGRVVCSPDENALSEYTVERKKFEVFTKELEKTAELPAETLDGYRITLAANIELPEEVAHVRVHGAEGIGLYRTEFLFMNRRGLPSEAEQFEAYKTLAEQVAPHPAVVRTLDLGGDKYVSHLEIPQEMNPSMGWRAIRFCLQRPEIFRTQLRAILRASAFGTLKIMYPLISGSAELIEANKHLEEVKKSLRAEGEPFDEEIEVGAMIEVPSAAMIADILADYVDFFSIGTNDLIQYSLAVDRVNEKIAHLYEPAHPGVLRMIKLVVDAAKAQGIWVGMCGEMASDPGFAFLLMGMGLDELSVAAVAIPEIKVLIRSATFKEAKKLAQRVITLRSTHEIRKEIRDTINGFAPAYPYVRAAWGNRDHSPA
jgi:phosphotransferase system enzyme I (PtsI)